jgi:hypothetical protein
LRRRRSRLHDRSGVVIASDAATDLIRMIGAFIQRRLAEPATH